MGHKPKCKISNYETFSRKQEKNFVTLLRKRFVKQKMKSTKERHIRMDFIKIKSIYSPKDIGKKTKSKHRPLIARKY